MALNTILQEAEKQHLTKLYGEDILQKCNNKISELVDFASNGLDALEEVKNGYEIGCSYGLIFMDCSMPIMDGYESTQAIRRFYEQKNIQ